jgi:hypothetical protein
MPVGCRGARRRPGCVNVTLVGTATRSPVRRRRGPGRAPRRGRANRLGAGGGERRSPWRAGCRASRPGLLGRSSRPAPPCARGSPPGAARSARPRRAGPRRCQPHRSRRRASERPAPRSAAGAATPGRGSRPSWRAGTAPGRPVPSSAHRDPASRWPQRRACAACIRGRAVGNAQANMHICRAFRARDQM